MKFLCPPFPFPSQWKRIQKIQIKNQEEFWSVPTELAPDPFQINCQDPIERESDKKLEEANDEDGFTFELNEEWAVRFAQTIERLKEKQKEKAKTDEFPDGSQKTPVENLKSCSLQTRKEKRKWAQIKRNRKIKKLKANHDFDNKTDC